MDFIDSFQSGMFNDYYIASDVSIMTNLLGYIDCKIVGPKYTSMEKNINLPSFVAGFLQEVINMKEFETVLKHISEKIKHLSFLVHLMCRYEDFDKVYSEYKSVQEDLEIGNIDWENDQYFREWEKLQVNKIETNLNQDNLNEDVDDEMESFYGEEIVRNV